MISLWYKNLLSSSIAPDPYSLELIEEPLVLENSLLAKAHWQVKLIYVEQMFLSRDECQN